MHVIRIRKAMWFVLINATCVKGGLGLKDLFQSLSLIRPMDVLSKRHVKNAYLARWMKMVLDDGKEGHEKREFSKVWV